MKTLKMSKKMLVSFALAVFAFVCFSLTAGAASTEADFIYSIVNNEVIIEGYYGKVTKKMVIPDKLEGYPVVAIDDHVFDGCCNSDYEKIETVILPDTLRTIGECAFRCCYNLKNIKLPQSLITIESGAFCACSSLTEIKIPAGVTEIIDNLFSSCTNLKKVEFSEKVTRIGYNSFSGCAIESFTYPEGVKEVELHTFSCCENLKKVYLPESIVKIDELAFLDCSSLTEISIPDGVLEIGSSAFSGCSSLKSIIIPDSVTDIGYSAFHECFALKTVYYTGTENQWEKIRIESNNGCLTDAKKHYNYLEHKYTFSLSATNYTYDGKVKTPTVTVKDTAGKVLKKGTDYTVTYSEGRKDTGTYNVTVKMIGKYTGTKTLTFKINPINISTCTVKLANTSFTYDGKVKAPKVTVTNSYGTKLTQGKHYTVTYSEGRKNVGTYKVTVKMIGNYTGTKTLTFKINPISISTCTVKLSATSYTYDGKVKAPTVTVTNSYGTKLTKDKHYTVTYASGRTAPGTYKVTVKMKGNYTGTKTLSFKIKPIDISTCKVKLSATSLTYNGKVRTPTVTVTNAYGTKLTKDKHYTVTYASGRKNVGTYKVTIKMIGNYTGTKTLTFKINPPKTTVDSLVAGTKSITVNLTKQTTQTTGYQIQYSTNKDFTNAKTKTITSNSTVKTTLSSLTSGKTYYVRVRTYKTVNDVKYYSDWSASKYVKTK